MYCPKCGKENDDSNSACVSCGNPLKQENQPSAQQLPEQQPKKKKKRGCLIFALIVVGIFLLFGLLLLAVDSDDTSGVSTTENILITKTLQEAPVTNGSNTEQIGTYAYIELTKDEFDSLTYDDFAEFALLNLKDNSYSDGGYNWVSIFSDDGTGAVWTGSIYTAIDFGTLDDEGCIIERTAMWDWDFDNNTYVEVDLGDETTTQAATTTTTTESSTTYSQYNALMKAYSYLDYSAFSRTGLIEQLEYEGFSNEDAVYAVDNCGADWKEQAVKKAKSYLDYSAFSHDGLVEQLEYEGFTHEEAVYGVEQNGL